MANVRRSVLKLYIDTANCLALTICVLRIILVLRGECSIPVDSIREIDLFISLDCLMGGIQYHRAPAQKENHVLYFTIILKIFCENLDKLNRDVED